VVFSAGRSQFQPRLGPACGPLHGAQMLYPEDAHEATWDWGSRIPSSLTGVTEVTDRPAVRR